MMDNVVFFRSISIMLNAGIGVHHALRVLAGSSENPRVGATYYAISEQLARGRGLSDAMSAYPQSFNRYQVSLIRVGEKSGSLTRVLESLANQLEKSWTLRKKLMAGLTYPGLLILACALLLLLAPSVLLEGHLRMLTESGVAIPPSTRILLFWSNLVRPSTLFLASLAGAPLVWKLWRSDAFWKRFHEVTRRLPYVGHILRQASTARFARSLALSLRAGVDLLEALRLSAAASGDSELVEAATSAGRSIINGGTLGESLKATHYFLPSFPVLIASGELVGRTDAMLDLGAGFCEQELDLALAALSTLLEPILLLAIGLLTAFMLVAVLQPMLSFLQAL